jgi:hypothetical protein
MTIIRAAALVLVLVCSATASMAQVEPKPDAGWKPVEGHLMTRWAKDVDPSAPLPEYPRPTMVRDKWMSLNGVWNYRIESASGGGTGGAAHGELLVPFPIESSLSGVFRKLRSDEKLICTREFSIPADWNESILLHFGAVNWECRVLVNGQEVGWHRGGYNRYSCDITKARRAGKNTIIVEVTNPGNSGGQPRGKQFDASHAIWYTASSGIWQTVWLEPVPEVHIESVGANADWKTGDVAFGVPLTHVGGLSQPISIIVRDGDTEVGRCEGFPPQPPKIHIANHKLWSPDSPHLYTYEVSTKYGERVTGYFAFRDVAIGKDDRGLTRLLLNGKPVFQYGPLDQGFWPDGLYTAPTDEALKSDILAAKKMGCNMIRKHVKVEPERWYYWCDNLGMLVWQDMPSAFFKTRDFDEGFPEIDDNWKANFERELKTMIYHLRNHPCIVMWVPFNEGWGQQDIDWARKVALSVKQQDPTRLVNNATGWSDMGVGDTRDVHNYPDPAMPPIERDKDRKLWGGRAPVLGEFGGLGLPIEGHTWVSKDNWGYRTYKTKEEVTDAYVTMMEQMPALIAQGLGAAVYTQTTDVEIECNGWLTYDREVWKIDPDKARAATLPLYARPPTIKDVMPCATGDPHLDKWWHTTARPKDDWYTPDFKQGGYWEVRPGGFGTERTPGARVNTPWSSADIWLRRNFTLDNVPEHPYLNIHHDEDAEVYINGTLAISLKGYTTSYQLVKLPKDAAALLKKGDNLIAIHCHQTTGGQYIDCGIVDIVPSK